MDRPRCPANLKRIKLSHLVMVKILVFVIQLLCSNFHSFAHDKHGIITTFNVTMVTNQNKLFP
jgi:hypothetical protein